MAYLKNILFKAKNVPFTQISKMNNVSLNVMTSNLKGISFKETKVEAKTETASRKYSTPTYTWADDYSSCIAKTTNTFTGEEVTENGTITSTLNFDEGKKIYKATFTKANFITQTKVVIIDYIKKGALIDITSSGIIEHSNSAITDTTYRILDVNGNEIKVFKMTAIIPEMTTYESGDGNDERLVYWTENCDTASFGSKTGPQYADSDLDIYLEEIFYYSLNGTIQNAIVAQNIDQDMWFRDASGSPSYNCSNYNGQYAISKHSDSVNIGERKIYVLSVQELVDYLGTENLNSNALDNMLHEYQNIWLRSANNETKVWYFKYNGLYCKEYNSKSYINPAFVLDLTKLEVK